MKRKIKIEIFITFDLFYCLIIIFRKSSEDSIINFFHSIFKDITGIPSYDNTNVENNHNLNNDYFYYHIGTVKHGFTKFHIRNEEESGRKS